MKLLKPSPATAKNMTTCERAIELCKQPSARIFWRPGGVVNWMLPELDAAEILEG